VGGWLVPIRQNYFVSDLAAEMKLPVLVVAQNRLGCLNHTLLTIRGVTCRSLTCVGVALNTVSPVADFASTTNAEVLRKITEVPILGGLTAEMTALPQDWRSAVEV
jgi:dethiobiotin synthetase